MSIPTAPPDLLSALSASTFRPTRWSRIDFRGLDIVATCDGWQRCWAGVVYREHRRWLLGLGQREPELRAVLVPRWPGVGRGRVDVVTARVRT